MTDNCCGTIQLTTTSSQLDQKIKSQFWNNVHNIIKLVIKFTIAYLYTKCQKNILITEATYYNSDISFPFEELSVEIEGDFDVCAKVYYIRENYLIRNKSFCNNKRNIKSLLNVSELILRKEFIDRLLISFKINDNLAQIEGKKGKITISNLMHYLNSSNLKVDTFYKEKYFYIEDELLFRQPNEFKRYQYFVHSRSIDNINETYNFPIIDENEYFKSIKDENDHFGIYLIKKNLLSHIKVEDKFCENLLYILGLMSLITEFIYPLLIPHIRDLCRKFCIKRPVDNHELIANEEKKTENRYLGNV